MYEKVENKMIKEKKDNLMELEFENDDMGDEFLDDIWELEDNSKISNIKLIFNDCILGYEKIRQIVSLSELGFVSSLTLEFIDCNMDVKEIKLKTLIHTPLKSALKIIKIKN